MREFIEYACIVLHTDADMEELENHLSMNGYNFGIDKKRTILFVQVDELDYVEEILADRDIGFDVRLY